jgi:hypothetical protein
VPILSAINKWVFFSVMLSAASKNIKGQEKNKLSRPFAVVSIQNKNAF